MTATFATKGRGQPPARYFYRGPVKVNPAIVGSDPKGEDASSAAPSEGSQSGLSDSEGIAQTTEDSTP